jgi:broad specificity phosphatase PhoE
MRAAGARTPMEDRHAMSTLVLIRHGQAAAFEADSDRLTDLGFEQARRLGAFWARRGVTFDEIYTGSLRRHRETAQTVAEVYRDHGLQLPDPERLPGWNEYDAEGILGKLLPRLAAEDAELRPLIEAFEHAEPRRRNSHFQRMFEVVVARWREGSPFAEEVESFADFHGRVCEALASVTQTKNKRRIAVFTSGGPIGVCVQTTLGAPLPAAIELNWRVRNCSVTELLFSGERRSLDGFNGVAHLEDPALHSFR